MVETKTNKKTLKMSSTTYMYLCYKWQCNRCYSHKKKYH